jgi:hypothetical protein
MTDNLIDRLHPISCLDHVQAPELATRLRTEGVVVYEIDGSTVRDAISFLAVARKRLPLDPPIANDSPNWDAFSDSLFGGIDLQGEATASTSFVVMWTHVENMLEGGLPDLLHVVNVFEQVSRQLRSPVDDEPRRSLSLVLVGEGRNFPRAS